MFTVFVCVGICFLSKCFLFVWFGKSWMGQTEDSVLQVCQLTELKQSQGVGNVPKPIPASLRPLLPENLGKYCREWPVGKTESEIKLLIQENSKPQDLIVYTDVPVTKEQSGWGLTVKQGATTIHGLNLHLDNGGGSRGCQEVTIGSHVPSSSQIQ